MGDTVGYAKFVQPIRASSARSDYGLACKILYLRALSALAVTLSDDGSEAYAVLYYEILALRAEKYLNAVLDKEVLNISVKLLRLFSTQMAYRTVDQLKACLDGALADYSYLVGIGNALKEIEETVGSVNVYKIGVELISEHLYNVFGFVFTHQTVVYVYANKLLANSLYKKRGNDRRVDTARKGEQNLFVAYLRANLGYLFINKFLCELGCCDSSHCIGSDVRIHKNSSSEIFVKSEIINVFLYIQYYTKKFSKYQELFIVTLTKNVIFLDFLIYNLQKRRNL